MNNKNSYQKPTIQERRASVTDRFRNAKMERDAAKARVKSYRAEQKLARKAEFAARTEAARDFVKIPRRTEREVRKARIYTLGAATVASLAVTGNITASGSSGVDPVQAAINQAATATQEQIAENERLKVEAGLALGKIEIDSSFIDEQAYDPVAQETDYTRKGSEPNEP